MRILCAPERQEQRPCERILNPFRQLAVGSYSDFQLQLQQLPVTHSTRLAPVDSASLAVLAARRWCSDFMRQKARSQRHILEGLPNATHEPSSLLPVTMTFPKSSHCSVYRKVRSCCYRVVTRFLKYSSPLEIPNSGFCLKPGRLPASSPSRRPSPHQCNVTPWPTAHRLRPLSLPQTKFQDST